MERKNVWILEDTKEYREDLEKIVVSYGFNPISFVARNPFLKAYSELENKDNVYGIILDNRVPIYDEPGCLPDEDIGVDIAYELYYDDLMDNVRVALYTSDDKNSVIQKVCDMGVMYHNKKNGTSWVKDFLSKS
ncbi:hypothetical protein KAS08_02920 [Candidatus Pacearchaeota archaeon]|nr:hypothetical protein [Candidatus Pacearchaeota archaeon]